MQSAEFRLSVRVDSQGAADWVVAEVCASGALGVEEITGPDLFELVIYFERSSEFAIRKALDELVGAILFVGEAESLSLQDWSEAWKDGLEAIEISSRLVVRPSFVDHTLSPEQCEVIVDPGCAFGTGGHESTRLALEWVDLLIEAPTPSIRVLDVGTGSGILALAALKLGAGLAVGFDLDADAIREAGRVAQGNGMGPELNLFAGSISALAAEPFDLVLVNLLRSEMLPIVEEIAGTLSPGSNLVLSGLLEADGERVLEAFGEFGLKEVSRRSLRDGSGGVWISPLLAFPC
jgi:ribosomal protein L11 methyltransferase